MVFLNKRGQDAGPVAVLIFILALLIVLYVLFLPAEDRADLIDLEDTDGDNTDFDRDFQRNKYERELLLEEQPGRLTPEGRDTFEYRIDSFTLFAETNANVLKEENPFVVRNGWGIKESYALTFRIENVDLINNVLLSFNAAEHEGILTVSLNDKPIFSQDINTNNPQPIRLDSDDLISGVNTLNFSVSSVGAAFWNVHMYQFDNVRILGDVTDISRQEAENIFFIPQSRQDIDIATLKYVPECYVDEVGVLLIQLNGRQVFNGVPECGRLNSQIIPPTYLQDDVNTLLFKTEEGSYLVDQIKITTETKDMQFPTYYFHLDDDLYRNITRDRDIAANLTLDFFVPENEYIDMQISVNGRAFGIFQRNKTFSKDIDTFLEEGNNAIRLITEEVVDIRELRLVVEDRDD